MASALFVNAQRCILGGGVFLTILAAPCCRFSRIGFRTGPAQASYILAQGVSAILVGRGVGVLGFCARVAYFAYRYVPGVAWFLVSTSAILLYCSQCWFTPLPRVRSASRGAEPRRPSRFAAARTFSTRGRAPCSTITNTWKPAVHVAAQKTLSYSL